MALQEAGGHELVHFTLGGLRFAVARGAVRAIRPSPRLVGVLGGPQSAADLPLVSLSAVLGLQRDTAIDRRVIEVVHWGDRLGLEVTAIEGIHRVGPAQLHALPELVVMTLGTRAVLGLVDVPGGIAVVLDLPLLLTERGVSPG